MRGRSRYIWGNVFHAPRVHGPAGVLWFDGGCAFCVRWVRRARGILRRREIVVAPFENGAREAEMRLRLRDGRVFGGADAVFYVAGITWWARPLAWAGRWRWVRRVARWIYARVAERRACAGGSCEVRLNEG